MKRSSGSGIAGAISVLGQRLPYEIIDDGAGNTEAIIQMSFMRGLDNAMLNGNFRQLSITETDVAKKYLSGSGLPPCVKSEIDRLMNRAIELGSMTETIDEELRTREELRRKRPCNSYR